MGESGHIRSLRVKLVGILAAESNAHVVNAKQSRDREYQEKTMGGRGPAGEVLLRSQKQKARKAGTDSSKTRLDGEAHRRPAVRFGRAREH
jgi:hypothetical protein